LDGQRCAWSTAGLADGGGEEHERRNLVEGEAVFVSGQPPEERAMGKGIRKPPVAHEPERVSLGELIHQHVRLATETAVHAEWRHKDPSVRLPTTNETAFPH